MTYADTYIKTIHPCDAEDMRPGCVTVRDWDGNRRLYAMPEDMADFCAWVRSEAPAQNARTEVVDLGYRAVANVTPLTTLTPAIVDVPVDVDIDPLWTVDMETAEHWNMLTPVCRHTLRDALLGRGKIEHALATWKEHIAFTRALVEHEVHV